MKCRTFLAYNEEMLTRCSFFGGGNMDLGMRVDATVHSISELHFLFLIEFLWKCIAPEGIRGGIRLVFTIKE